MRSMYLYTKDTSCTCSVGVLYIFLSELCVYRPSIIMYADAPQHQNLLIYSAFGSKNINRKSSAHGYLSNLYSTKGNLLLDIYFIFSHPYIKSV